MSTKKYRRKAQGKSYMIDRPGTVRYAWTDEISKAMLEKYITPLLKEDS